MIIGEPEDMYRFRTPTLRNVSMTVPYGHNVVYANLDDIGRANLSTLPFPVQFRQSIVRNHVSDSDAGCRPVFLGPV